MINNHMFFTPSWHLEQDVRIVLGLHTRGWREYRFGNVSFAPILDIAVSGSICRIVRLFQPRSHQEKGASWEMYICAGVVM